MTRLLLLRHAKSSWDDTTLPDHDRPLAPRGRRAAELMGEHLRSNGPFPDLILCSSAERTRETLRRMSLEVADADVLVEDTLYGAGDDDLLDRLRDVPDAFQTVAVIGHNPGIQDLAVDLAKGGGDLGRLRAKFPTGALAVLSFEGAWADLGPGRASLDAFVAPRDLA